MIEITKSAGRRLAAFAISLGVASLAVGAPSAALAATTGQPTCFALEQNCLKHVAKVRAFSEKLKSSATMPVDGADTRDDRCYDAFAAAKQSGVWPARKALPAIACTN